MEETAMKPKVCAEFQDDYARAESMAREGHPVIFKNTARYKGFLHGYEGFTSSPYTNYIVLEKDAQLTSVAICECFGDSYSRARFSKGSAMGIVDSLVKSVRTASAERRKSLAVELAQTRTSEGTAELRRMVERRYKGMLTWYSADDQLTGIEALGETARPDALEYLVHIYQPTVEHGYDPETYPVRIQGDNPPYGSAEIEVVRFPNAVRSLRNQLAYHISTNYYSGSDYAWVDTTPEQQEAAHLKAREKEPHPTLKNTMVKLGDSIPMDRLVQHFIGAANSTEATLDMQLSAIGWLGRSGTQAALDFIESLQVFDGAKGGAVCAGHSTAPGNDPLNHISHPNAKGKLGYVLSYQVCGVCGPMEHPQEVGIVTSVMETAASRLKARKEGKNFPILIVTSGEMHRFSSKP
jgi:hypothetical protein